jgi:hypothetical protein
MSERELEQAAAEHQGPRPSYEILAGDFSFQLFEPPAKRQDESNGYDVHVQYQGGAVFEPMPEGDFFTFTLLDGQYPIAVYEIFAGRGNDISFEEACDFTRGATQTFFLVQGLRHGLTVNEWWEADGKEKQVIVKHGEQILVPEPDQSPEMD